jgi:hypothetical protein
VPKDEKQTEEEGSDICRDMLNTTEEHQRQSAADTLFREVQRRTSRKRRNHDR